MTIEEKLELHSTMASLPISDEKLHRINELMDKAYDEMAQKGRADAIDEFMKEIKDTYGYDSYSDLFQLAEQIKEQSRHDW